MGQQRWFATKRVVTAVFGLTLAGAAQAQGSVTLYGLVDAGLLFTNKSPNASTGQNAGKQFSLIDSGDSPSEFGLSGVEDLGAGMKAEFKLESGISMANGAFNDSNGNMFGRQAWVGLTSGLGEFKAGLQFSPFFLSLYELDPRGLPLFGSSVVNYVDNVVGTGIFNANALSWTSPVIAGLQGSVMFALGGEAGNFPAGRQYSASLKYDNGSLMVDASVYNGNAGGTAQTPVPTTQAFLGRMLGASYKFGTVTVKASFTSYKVAGSFNNNVYGGGVDYLVLPDLDLNGGVWFTSDRNRTTNHSVMGAVGAQYFLSRRTTLYGQVGVVNNHGAMDTGLSINGALNGVTGTTVGANLGIRHVF
ncbi:porin [Paraburkholderia silviterrae]|uniref:Porin n=1 Tax=Paraburkholderia silviterrae TaxID=2528715 RepID=A0A4R5MFY6_9BURK|nr:porin [Paraburkholderia silviterrae]TDG26215.1 porin [Paraburkholderia silviterrae]